MADEHEEGYQEALRRIDDNYKSKSSRLELDGLELTELPPSIGKLTHLINLYLGYNYKTNKRNHLKTLLREIGQLTNLQKLYLDDNEISELPKEIGQLINLESLSLNRNQIRELPKEITQLTNLQQLSLTHNQIRELPKEITRLTNLQVLFLHGNPLNIPPEIIERYKEAQLILNYYFENVYEVKEEDIRPLKEVKELLNSVSSQNLKEFENEPYGEEIRKGERLEKKKYYDVAFSYAGEEREYVHSVYEELRQASVSVFYDRDEEISDDLWAKDLIEELDDIYRNRSKCVVVFVSENYAKKVWTKHESKSALARALNEKREYILPARFDDTELPGFLPTVAFVDLRNEPPQDFARKIIRKLNRLKVLSD